MELYCDYVISFDCTILAMIWSLLCVIIMASAWLDIVMPFVDTTYIWIYIIVQSDW